MANKKRKKGQVEEMSLKSAFQRAIENTEEVKDGFCVGKHAIKSADRSKIVASDDKKLQGSLDIDSQVRVLYHNENRWDYALSYDDRIYFFEIHPAVTSEVDAVIKKLTWLKCWLKTKAPAIDELPKADYPYTWVQSGGYAILPNTRERKKLSVSGIVVANKLILK